MKSVIIAFLAIYASVAVAAETGLLGGASETIVVNKLQVSDKKETFVHESVAPETEADMIEKSIIPNPCSLAVVDCEDDVVAIIYEIFGSDAKTAVKIARCESQLNSGRVGDKHLMFINDETGELVGDSIGIFQIRTGAKNWNRAARNGMSADDFRVWMEGPRENVKYAKTIYERRGWGAWYNCAHKIGVIK